MHLVELQGFCSWVLQTYFNNVVELQFFYLYFFGRSVLETSFPTHKTVFNTQKNFLA